jgi:hypothetical protein
VGKARTASMVGTASGALGAIEKQLGLTEIAA